MPVSFNDFIKSLSDTGLVQPEEVSSIMDNLPADKTMVNVEQFAKDLVKQKKLTRFQAAAIYQGQSRGLCFGDYVVLDKIGSGGMGQVFKAQHRRLKRQVAIKLLRASGAKSEKAVKRFQREAETAAKLNHPNIVGVHDAGELDGMHFIVMEYVEGRDLQSVVKEKGPFPVDQAVTFVLQSARGFQHAHENGIIHRDIKPSNLLLDKNGNVTILDMGLARMDQSADSGEPGGEDEGRLTMPGQMMGTVNYVSPEQAVDAHEVDARSDVYSLGCTFYYLVRGKPPYHRDNMALTLLAHCESPIPNLREELPAVSERLNAIFQKMMAKRPANRYASMAELIADLESCVTGDNSGFVSPAALVAKPGPGSASVADFSKSKLPTFHLAADKSNPATASTRPPVPSSLPSTQVAAEQPAPAPVPPAPFVPPEPAAPALMSELADLAHAAASDPVLKRPGSQKTDFLKWYIIGGVVALLVVAGVIYLTSGKKKKSPKQKPRPAASAPAEEGNDAGEPTE